MSSVETLSSEIQACSLSDKKNPAPAATRDTTFFPPWRLELEKAIDNNADVGQAYDTEEHQEWRCSLATIKAFVRILYWILTFIK
jgi:hypothetical protein